MRDPVVEEREVEDMPLVEVIPGLRLDVVGRRDVDGLVVNIEFVHEPEQERPAKVLVDLQAFYCLGQDAVRRLRVIVHEPVQDLLEGNLFDLFALVEKIRPHHR
ncbi:MAG: hypothetical protein EXS64_03865 [Candidatus Latescibacteria bacterium]|nr:hypothetical protein [Candidatus Latescibacterota bacterium]